MHMWQSHSLLIINRFANKALESHRHLISGFLFGVEAGLSGQLSFLCTVIRTTVIMRLFQSDNLITFQ